MSLPTSLNQLNIEKFAAFLVARGAQRLISTNEYEVLRIQTDSGVHVLYRNKHNSLTWSNELEEAYRAWKTGKAWRATAATKRPQSTNKKNPRKRTLLKRDGADCFFCLDPLGDDITLEHLIPLTSNGPDNLSNCVLAHERCNSGAGHLSLREKIALREKNLLAKQPRSTS